MSSPSACGEGGAARLAIQMYMKGENACDRGDATQGISLMRRAMDMLPELDQEEWPQWAERLRVQLEYAASHPPPSASADVDLQGLPMTDSQAEFIAHIFRSRHYVVVDNLVDLQIAADARAEIARADDDGELEISTVYAGPEASAVSVAEVRSPL